MWRAGVPSQPKIWGTVLAEPGDVDIYCPFYVGDFLRNTSDLSTEEVGAYQLLLWHAWSKDGYINGDQRRLARIARVDYSRWPEIWEVISRFWTKNGDGFFQKRMVEVRQQALSKHESAIGRGRASAVARAAKRAQEEAQLQLSGQTQSSQFQAEGADAGQQSKSKSDPKSESKAHSDPEGASALPLSTIWPAEEWLRRFKPLWNQLRSR